MTAACPRPGRGWARYPAVARLPAERGGRRRDRPRGPRTRDTARLPGSPRAPGRGARRTAALGRHPGRARLPPRCRRPSAGLDRPGRRSRRLPRQGRRLAQPARRHDRRCAAHREARPRRTGTRGQRAPGRSRGRGRDRRHRPARRQGQGRRHRRRAVPGRAAPLRSGSALEWRDIEPAADIPGALRIRVRRSKTDQAGNETDIRLVKNGAADALAAIRSADADPRARVFGGLNGQSIGRRFAAAAPRRRHRGGDLPFRPRRPRLRADRARRVDDRSHALRRLEDRPHGRPLQCRREGRTRRRRKVPLAAEQPVRCRQLGARSPAQARTPAPRQSTPPTAPATAWPERSRAPPPRGPRNCRTWLAHLHQGDAHVLPPARFGQQERRSASLPSSMSLSEPASHPPSSTSQRN